MVENVSSCSFLGWITIGVWTSWKLGKTHWTPKLLPNDLGTWHPNQVLSRCCWLKSLGISYFFHYNQNGETLFLVVYAMIGKADDQLIYGWFTQIMVQSEDFQ